MTEVIVRRMRDVYDSIAEEWTAKDPQITPGHESARKRFAEEIGIAGPILELGCGAGRDLAWFTQNADRLAVGCDLSIGMLAIAGRRSRAPRIQADMSFAPFETEAFGAVWCSAALLHVPKNVAGVAVAEMFRVLRPGGALYVSLQRGDGEGWQARRFGPVERYFSLYSSEEARDLLEAAGFVDVRVQQTEEDIWMNFLGRRPA